MADLRVNTYTKSNYILNPKGNVLSRPNRTLAVSPSTSWGGGGAGIIVRESLTTPEGPYMAIVKEWTTQPTSALDSGAINFNSNYYGLDTTGFPAKPSSNYVISFWMNRPANMSISVFVRMLNDAGTLTTTELRVAQASGAATGWQKIEGAFTTTFDTTTVKLLVYHTAGSVNLPVGTRFETAAFVFEEGTTASTYFDGDTAGYVWSGAANGSVTNSVARTAKSAPVMINARANYVSYPNFAGTGTIATGWAGYANGGSGTRSFSNNSQTITLTSTSGGLGRYGVSLHYSNVPITAFSGEVLYFSGKIDISAMAVDTDTEALAVLYFTDGTTANWGVYRTSSTMLERTYTVPVDKTVMGVTYYFFIRSTIPTWTGTSTVKFSEALITKKQPNETWTTYPYFDGSTAGAKWQGAVNASPSLKGELVGARVLRWNGTAWL